MQPKKDTKGLRRLFRRLFGRPPAAHSPRPAFVPLFPGGHDALLQCYARGYAAARADAPLDLHAYGDAAGMHQYRKGWNDATRGVPPDPRIEAPPPEPAMIEALSTAPAPRGLRGVPPPDPKPPDLGAMTGPRWLPSALAEAAASPVAPPQPGAAVIRHRLRSATDYTNSIAYGCVIPRVQAEELQRLSAWVYLPAGFAGTEVAMNCAGHPAVEACRATLTSTETWQQIWTLCRIPLTVTDLHAVLCIVGEAGSEVHSCRWALEAAALP